jgi:hypothetical protein
MMRFAFPTNGILFVEKIWWRKFKLNNIENRESNKMN